MNWTVEGKIGEWKVECDPNGNLQSIEFEIKATNEYQIKPKDKNYNCFVLNLCVFNLLSKMVEFDNIVENSL